MLLVSIEVRLRSISNSLSTASSESLVASNREVESIKIYVTVEASYSLSSVKIRKIKNSFSDDFFDVSLVFGAELL